MFVKLINNKGHGNFEKYRKLKNKHFFRKLQKKKEELNIIYFQKYNFYNILLDKKKNMIVNKN